MLVGRRTGEWKDRGEWVGRDVEGAFCGDERSPVRMFPGIREEFSSEVVLVC